MKLHSLITAAIGGLMFAGASMVSAGTVIFTSSFESDNITNDANFVPNGPGTGYENFVAGASLGTGDDNWIVAGSGGVDIIRDAYSPTPFMDGDQAVDLDGWEKGSISQSISTTAGHAYAMTFWLSGNAGTGYTGFSTVITAVDVPPPSTVLADVTKGSVSSSWQSYEVDFTALSSSTIISFAADEPAGTSGPTLDDVVITDESGKSVAIPLPASALGGSALLGMVFLAKIRSRKNAA